MTILGCRLSALVYRLCLRLAAMGLSAAVLLGLSDAGAGEGWTRFRGPNGTGIAEAEGLPVRWTEKDYNWRVKLPGAGHSSPVVWGDRVFLTSGDRKTAQRFLVCLKTSDGSTLWQRDYESKKHDMSPSNSYGTSTPAVDEERVYAYWTSPEEVTLLALTHEGKDAWRRNLGKFVAEHGSGTSPIVFEDLVILANDQDEKGSLIAVNRRTGETVWEIKRRSSDIEYRGSYSTPMVYQPEGGPPQILFTSRAFGVTSVDPKAGKILWEVADAFPGRVVISPVLAAGLIVGSCGQSEEGMQVTAVRPPTKDKPAGIAYTVTKSAPFVPTPIVRDGLLFLWGDAGDLVCLRAATGERVWREKIGSNFFGSPVRVGERLYCMSRQGDVFVVAAKDSYELLSRNPLGEATFATPAIAGGVLYLRTLSHLISVGGKKP